MIMYFFVALCILAVGRTTVIAQQAANVTRSNSTMPKFGSNPNNPLGLVFVWKKEWENPSTNQFGASIRIGSANSTIDQEWILQFQFPNATQNIVAGNFEFKKDDGQYTLRTFTKEKGVIIGGKQISHLVFNGTMEKGSRNEPPQTVLFSIFPDGILAAQTNPASLMKVKSARYDVFVDGKNETTPATPSAQFLALMQERPPSTNKPPATPVPPASDLNILFYIIFPCLGAAILFVVGLALFFKHKRDVQAKQAHERLSSVYVSEN